MKEWVEPSEDERERLYILIEELNEAQHIATKILRFGYSEVYPKTKTTNRKRLEQELGDVFAMVEFLVEEGDISAEAISMYREAKRERLKRFTRGVWGRRG